MSTTLQKYFISDPRINHIAGNRTNEKILKIINSIYNDSDEEFNTNSKKNRKILNDFYDPKKLNIFSNEEFLDPDLNINFEKILYRISQLSLKDFKVLIVIRDQLSLIQSIYAQKHSFYKNKNIRNINEYFFYLKNKNRLRFYDYNFFLENSYNDKLVFVSLNNLKKKDLKSYNDLLSVLNSSELFKFNHSDLEKIFSKKFNSSLSSNGIRHVRHDDIISDIWDKNLLMKFMKLIVRTFFSTKNRKIFKNVYNYFYLNILKVSKFIIVLFKIGQLNFKIENEKELKKIFENKNKKFLSIIKRDYFDI